MRLLLLLFLLCGSAHSAAALNVGSKKFTESVLLAEVLRVSMEAKGVESRHIAELGGTRILWNALLAGNIDVYPEYTGTIEAELLQKRHSSFADLREALRLQGIGISEPLGFNNTYALGMAGQRARELAIQKISDLAGHPGIKIGWSEEFRRRDDGWPGLKQKYRLPQSRVRGLDHDVAYRALQSGDIDLMDLYSTDAEIEYYDLFVLEDDLHYFPVYKAVYLYRLESLKSEPLLAEALDELAGKISAQSMISMNKEAKIEKTPAEMIASQFVNRTFNAGTNPFVESRLERMLTRTKEHLYLVGFSLFFAVLAGVPLGFLAAYHAGAGQVILWTVGAIQTIPSLALLVVLIKPLNLMGLTGIGDTPALIALFLYSLLPLVRGAHAGFQNIPRPLRETAAVLGLRHRTRIWRIELPLALPVILSGIKTAAVMNIGFATLGALVGAGGYGQPILTGIRLDDYSLILEGALPSAALALIAQQIFDWAERFLVSPGLRK